MNFNKAPCGKCVYFDKLCPVSQTCEKYKSYNTLRKARKNWLNKVKEIIHGDK